MAQAAHTAGHEDGGTRRDFLYLATGAMGAVGLASVVWPFIHQMNPSADVLAMSTTDVDLSPIQVGQAITVVWQGKPVFVRHRTEQEIEEAQSVDLGALPDPEPDAERVEKPEWLVVVGVCTHLGCVPLGTKSGDPKGDYDGWFCPCHGSHYDSSGRVRRGPAPTNLLVPEYTFLEDQKIRIG